MVVCQNNSFHGMKLPRGILEREDEEVLFEYGKGQVLEIGMFFGRSSVLLAQNADKVYSIDRFTGWEDHPQCTYSNVLESLKNYKNTCKIEILKGYSEEFKDKFPDRFFDVLFIDGSHDYDSVDADFNMYSTKVKLGGFILFHDYDSVYHPDIIKYCDELKVNSLYEFIGIRGVVAIFKRLSKEK